MTNTSPTPADPQAILLQVLGRMFAATATEPACDVRAAVLDALGGGAQAGAILDSMAAVLAYATTELPKDSNLLDEESLATETANRVVLPLQTVRVQARIDALETAGVGGTLCPEQGCGSKAHSHGREPRTLTGRHGKMPLLFRRSTCQKPECGHTFSFAAIRLGVGSQRFTPGCAETITMLATAVPHGKAVTLLGQLLRIEVSEHATQDLVETRGAALLKLDKAAANTHAPYDKSDLERTYGRPADAIAANDAPDVVYLETDGVFPMTRELVPERSVEVPGARGGKGRKFNMEGREVKNAVLYTAKAQAQEMPSRGCILQRHYVSHLGHWLPFALLVWLAMLRMRFDQAKLLVVLSDGAEWIRTFAKWLPMGNRVLLILDLYHALHRIWEVARAIHGDKTEQCGQRARLWSEVVEQGHVAMVIDELREIRDARPAVQEKVDDLVTYFENNKNRMNYPEYRLRGLRVTSGIVESANFHVTGARLKQQGMRWSERGASEIAALRADLCNERWAERSRQLLAA